MPSVDMSHTTREYRYDRVDHDSSSWFLPSPLTTIVLFVHLFKIGMRVVHKMLEVQAIAPSLRENLILSTLSGSPHLLASFDRGCCLVQAAACI